MELQLKRIYKGSNYTIGHLYINNVYCCDTIEDVDRGLSDTMTEEQIRKIKVKSQTAIPTGRYRVTLNVVSPKFFLKPYYKAYCGGKLPRLLNVKGFDGILMHKGVNQNSSAGCIIVGYNKIKGQVVDSQKAFEKLYSQLKSSKDNIYITIE